MPSRPNSAEPRQCLRNSGRLIGSIDGPLAYFSLEIFFFFIEDLPPQEPRGLFEATGVCFEGFDDNPFVDRVFLPLVKKDGMKTQCTVETLNSWSVLKIFFFSSLRMEIVFIN